MNTNIKKIQDFCNFMIEIGNFFNKLYFWSTLWQKVSFWCCKIEYQHKKNQEFCNFMIEIGNFFYIFLFCLIFNSTGLTCEDFLDALKSLGMHRVVSKYSCMLVIIRPRIARKSFTRWVAYWWPQMKGNEHRETYNLPTC